MGNTKITNSLNLGGSKKRKVLIVEDDFDLLSAVSEFLNNYSYLPIKAQNLPEAVNKVSNQKFNLIILDLGLQNTNGVKLIEKIRKNPTSINFRTPILLHSGHIEISLFDKYKDDFNDALVKPTSLETILEKVTYWSNREHSAIHFGNIYDADKFAKKITK